MLKAGDVILGLASSGVHSNGYSLVRRIVEASGLGYDAPAPFDPARSLGEALLEPTRIYVKPLLEAIRGGGGIKALAHITGGGFTENIPRVLPDHLAAEIDLSALSIPPVFSWLRREGGIATPEMLRTFNCGVGMIVVVGEAAAATAAAMLQAAGEPVLSLGRLAPRDGDGVVFTGEPSFR